MDKLTFEELAIEITRKCNRRCIHCMRGTAQKSTITKDIIDKIFLEIANCKRIALTGGEPLLAINMIEYLVDKIILSEWDIEIFQLTTNGTIIDERIIQCLSRLCNNKNRCCSLLRISGDKFHNVNQSQLAYESYNSFSKDDRVTVLLKDEIKSIKYSGRAKNIVEDDLGQLSENFIGIAVPYINKYRIPVKSYCVQTEMIVLSNGNVSFNEEVSYDELDLLSIGNLNDNNIKEMIEIHNRDCLLTHCDWDNIRTIKQSLTGFNNFGLSVYLKDKVGDLIFDKIYKLRIKAHELFPYIPVQNIILNLPMPKDYVLDITDEIDLIYEIVNPIFNDMPMSDWLEWLQGVDNDLFILYETNQDKFEADIRKLFSVYALLQKPSSLEAALIKMLDEYTFYFRLVTTQNCMETLEFLRLEQLNEKYKTGQLKYSNDKLLAYEIGDSLFGEPNVFQEVVKHLEQQSGEKENAIELKNGIKAII